MARLRLSAAIAATLLVVACVPPDPQSLAVLLHAAPEVSFALHGSRQVGPDELLVESLVFPVDPVAAEYPRIPLLLGTNDGTLVAIASIRRGSIADSAPSGLRAAVSHDGGRTWAHHHIAENTTTADGDAAGVVDPATGRIFVFGHELYTSDDGGVTWTARPKTILPNAAGVVGIPNGPGAGLGLQSGPHAGRLVVMCRAFLGPEPFPWPDPWRDRSGHTNCTLTSDDGGVTWQTSTTVQGWVGEGAVVELGDGRLYMSSRTYRFDGRRSEAYSSDGGTTWGDFDRSVLPEPIFGVNGSLVRVTDPLGGAGTVVYANEPEWGGILGLIPLSRKDLSLYVSEDDTATWRFGKVLHRGPSAYSSMAALGSDVGILYEAVVQDVNDRRSASDPPEGIRFARIDVAALTG